jgi:RND family efflux transporter MFP subunit
VKRARNLVIIVVILVAAVAIAVVAGKRGNDAVAVKTIAIKRTAFQTKLPETGVVQHPRVVTVPTLVGGNVGEIDVKPGDFVSAGQTLATVQNPTLESTAAGSQADYDSAVATIRTSQIDEQNAKVQYQANVDTAKSSLDEARRIYDADVALYKNKAVPRNQVDADKAKLDQAQVAYDQAVRQMRLGAVTGYGTSSVQYAKAAAQKAQIINASNQQQLSFTRITSPIPGVVQTLATQPSDPLTPLHPGDPVTAGQALFTVAESDRFIVKAEVDEQDVIDVHRGQQANITGEDFPGITLTGRVVDISPVAIKSTDPSSTARQVLTTIALDRSPSFLRDGMSVDVDILTANVPNTILVPSAAVQKDGKESYVYVVRGGKAVKTAVKTGSSNDTQTVIKSGLRPGEVIVAEKNPLVHAGGAVTPAPSPSASSAI